MSVSGVLDCGMSADQVVAMDLFHYWLNQTERQEFRLGGLAGTGKTTLIKAMLDLLGSRQYEVITPTNKASSVLRNKGVPAKTCHGLLCDFQYETEDDNGRTVPVFTDKGVKRHVVLCDEASMVTSEMRQKILACAERVVWIGDYGQLPPVEPGRNVGGVLRESNLDAKLTKQHRHGDARVIVDFAGYLREGGDPLIWSPPKTGASGQVTVNRKGVRGVAKVAQMCLEEGLWPVIGFRNVFNDRFNAEIRRLQGKDLKSVYPGLKLACNFTSYRHGVAASEVFEVARVTDVWAGDVTGIITTEGRKFPISFKKENQGGAVRVQDGYAITCHKSQGSEWPKICVIEDSEVRGYVRQWRYTGATRAQNRVEYFTKGTV